MTKKLEENSDRSCWGEFLAGRAPTSSRALERINRRETGFEEQVLQLLSGIESAFSKKSEEELPVEKVRRQYVKALAAIYRFLLDIDVVQADHFLRLGDALADLNIGVRPPLLVAKRTRAHPTPSQILRARADVVFAVDLLAAAGEKAFRLPHWKPLTPISPLNAAKELLKKFPHIKNLAGPKSQKQSGATALAKTILEWRKVSRNDDNPEHGFASGRKWLEEHADLWTAKRLHELAYESARDADRVGVSVPPSNPH